jgi:hypothetical protein
MALPAVFGREESLAVGARVPWESYVPASLSQADVHAIRTLSSAPPARVAELLAARDAEALLYPQALVKVRPPARRPLSASPSYRRAAPRHRCPSFAHNRLPTALPPDADEHLGRARHPIRADASARLHRG